MQRHSFIEDLLATLIGTSLVALGLFFYKESGLLIGGTAGLSLLLERFSNLSFGQLFLLVNLPFFLLAWWQMGRSFTLRSLTCVSMVSLMTDHMHRVLTLQSLNPIYAALGGGILIGIGLLSLFRHNSSLGGINILGLFLQKRRLARAGTVQLTLDCLILAASVFMVSLPILGLSVCGALLLNSIIVFNHRHERYLGASV